MGGGSTVYQFAAQGSDIIGRTAHTVTHSLRPDFDITVKGQHADGVLTATFTRPFAARNDKHLAIEPGVKYHILMARRTSDNELGRQHNKRVASQDKIDFFKEGPLCDEGQELDPRTKTCSFEASNAVVVALHSALAAAALLLL